MRNVFFGVFACVCALTITTAIAGEEQRVLIPPAEVTKTPATVIVATDCPCEPACDCSTVVVSNRLVRRGVFANKPARRAAVVVIRNTGVVVQRAGNVAYNVVTWPARVCQSGSCR